MADDENASPLSRRQPGQRTGHRPAAYSGPPRLSAADLERMQAAIRAAAAEIDDSPAAIGPGSPAGPPPAGQESGAAGGEPVTQPIPVPAAPVAAATAQVKQGGRRRPEDVASEAAASHPARPEPAAPGRKAGPGRLDRNNAGRLDRKNPAATTTAAATAATGPSAAGSPPRNLPGRARWPGRPPRRKLARGVRSRSRRRRPPRCGPARRLRLARRPRSVRSRGPGRLSCPARLRPARLR